MIERWVETWKVAGPELARIRLREVRDEDTLLSLPSLALCQVPVMRLIDLLDVTRDVLAEAKEDPGITRGTGSPPPIGRDTLESSC